MPTQKTLAPLSPKQQTVYHVYCPGSVMLFGEHAILHGFDAICCAIDKRLSLMLYPHNDHSIVIKSSLGDINTSLKNWPNDLPDSFNYLKGVMAHVAENLSTGFRLEINSCQLPHQYGFGSSACIIAGTLSLFQRWLTGFVMTKKQLLAESLTILHAVTNNKGSGYDLAASIYGGVIQYNANSRKVTPIASSLPINLVYCGYKTKSHYVIDQVNEKMADNRQFYAELFKKIGQIVASAQNAIKQNDQLYLGQLMYENQALLDRLGVNDTRLSEIYDVLRNQPSILGAKISGAGLGDCLVALGVVNPAWFSKLYDKGVRVIDIKVSQKGLSDA